MSWDLTTATYVSLKSVAAQDTTLLSVTLSGDGTKMFVLGRDNNSVYRYDLSTAWDITAAVYVSLKSVAAQDAAPLGVTFSPDGTKMFMVGYTSKSVYRYDLSTAWDLTTATYVSLKSVSAQDSISYGMAFSGDGTKMFVVGDANNSVYRHDLSTAWDITTAVYVSLKSVAAQDTLPLGATFSPDGTKMFMVGYINNSIYRYDLSAAWDITTATYVSTKSAAAQDATARGIALSGDGTKMFVVGDANNSVYRYDMIAPPATVTGTPAAASSASDAEVTAGSLVLTGTPADATSATDAAPTSEDFSTATPPERTHTVTAESRRTIVPAENRVTTIPAESRTTTIGAP